MILSELVADAYLVYRGKLSSVPAAGTEKYSRIVAIADRKQKEWAQDSNVDWPSRYEIREIGSLSAGNQSYDIDEDTMRLSDYVILTDSNGNKNFINVIKPQLMSRVNSGCFITGFDPKQLTFVQTITADHSGKQISVPCFTLPTTIKNANDLIVVDNPQWLVYATAAELARNDFAKEAQYANIIGQANDLYTKMVDNAQANGFLQLNGVANNMPQYTELNSNYNAPWNN